VCNEAHIERLTQSEHFGTNVPKTNCAESFVCQPDAHVLGPFGESCGALSPKKILLDEFSAQRQNEGEDGYGHSTADL
jgi:hypothetical protein